MSIRVALLLLLSLLLLCGTAEAQQPGTAPNYDVPIHGHGQYISTPSGQLYYEREGQGPPVILVAGGPGGSHSSFHPWFSRLAATHTVIYFDNIGRGRSDRLKNPSGYTVVRDADDIECLRKALGFSTITVLGHSYGGMPALAYALKYPSTTDHLILSDTLLNARTFQMNIDNCNRESETRFPQVWSQLTAMRKKGIKTGSDQYENLYGSTVGDLYWYNPDNESKLFHSGDPLDGLNGDVYLAMIGDSPEWSVTGTMRGYDPTKLMKSCTIPTLICVGRYDRVATPQIAQMIKDALPTSTSQLVVFEKSGHRPWIEQSDQYFQTVLTFLGGPK
jgi:proline iminopeptidase